MKKNSILTDEYNKCFICQSERNLEEHHVFFGTSNRKQSEKYGMKVPLCPDCHRGQRGVHHNKQLDLYIKRYAQLQFEKEYPYEEFMKIFGRSYRDNVGYACQNFGNNLKKLRKKRGLTQQDLYNDLNKKYGTMINNSMISRWENNENTPHINYIVYIADYFNISIDELVR